MPTQKLIATQRFDHGKERLDAGSPFTAEDSEAGVYKSAGLAVPDTKQARGQYTTRMMTAQTRGGTLPEQTRVMTPAAPTPPGVPPAQPGQTVVTPETPAQTVTKPAEGEAVSAMTTQNAPDVVANNAA